MTDPSAQLSGANLRGAVDLSSLVRPPAGGPDAAGGAPGPGAGAGGTVSVPALVVEVGDATFSTVLDVSNTVPVIVEFYAGEPGGNLGRIVTEYAGRLLLATVNAQTNPQLQQAFAVAAVPTVAAVIGGRPLALFEGQLDDANLKSVFDQVLAMAAQNGVTGTVSVDGSAEPEAPVEQPLPPLHQEAYDAIERGDYPAAISSYQKAIAQDPRDDQAVAGLAQVGLLHRLTGLTAAEIRTAAAEGPQDLAAQLAVADLDVSGGHLDDAFDRLLTLFPALEADGKDTVRARLLDYFHIAGAEDPRVMAARRRLTSLLY